MKTKLFFCLFIIGIYNVKAQYTAIPDVQFETVLIRLGYDSGVIDHKVLTNNINKITSLNVTPKGMNPKINDLTGIQDFVALKSLNCVSNNLTSLDLSSLTALTDLDCSSNQLTNINFNGARSLINLNCIGNKLSVLDFREQMSLKNLNCHVNPLTSLNVSGLTALESLNCSSGSLKSLDVSGLPALTILDCSINLITSLNVSGATTLANLNCSQNKLVSIDLSGLTALTWARCDSNQLTSLNLTGTKALKSLKCINNQFTSLDVSEAKAMTNLDCSKNILTNLNITGLTALDVLLCNYNQLTSLDLTGHNLSYLNCYNNPLLLCIQVDNVATANSNRSWGKPAAASYSLNCGLSTGNFQVTSYTVNVFPNPTKNLVHIDLENELSGKITDLAGKTLMTVNTKDVDVSSLSAGIYLLDITSEDKRYVSKIVKE